METNSTTSMRQEKLPDENDEFPVNFVAYGMIAACFVLLLLLVIPVLIYVFISKNRARREELRKKLVSLEPIQIATPGSTSRSREQTTTGSQELSKEKTQEKDANRKTTSGETIGVERRNRTKSKRRIGSGNRRATVHISMANTVTTPNRRRSRARRGSHSAELMPTKK
ncbi:hypothetical protein OESDEN_18215 [Oesophagostomum dentatum]|uniref:Uncharacterized protein n=1 Tax=Oesophagostomum dentatum TaxID=61180 RepID=A0A0B1S9Y1_OESDE|nr:hypothetical protein OESDEN_18215 [Oesophagostomum dentatum]